MQLSGNQTSLKTTKYMASALVSVMLLATILTACVTINIYFPAAAAEKAADKIIDDVWQLNPNGKPVSGKSDSGKTDSGAEVKPASSTEIKPADVK